MSKTTAKNTLVKLGAVMFAIREKYDLCLATPVVGSWGVAIPTNWQHQQTRTKGMGIPEIGSKEMLAKKKKFEHDSKENNFCFLAPPGFGS